MSAGSCLVVEHSEHFVRDEGRVLINAQSAAGPAFYSAVTARRRFFTPTFTLSKKLESPLSSVKRIIQVGALLRGPTRQAAVGVAANFVGPLLHADNSAGP